MAASTTRVLSVLAAFTIVAAAGCGGTAKEADTSSGQASEAEVESSTSQAQSSTPTVSDSPSEWTVGYTSYGPVLPSTRQPGLASALGSLAGESTTSGVCQFNTVTSPNPNRLYNSTLVVTDTRTGEILFIAPDQSAKTIDGLAVGDTFSELKAVHPEAEFTNPSSSDAGMWPVLIADPAGDGFISYVFETHSANDFQPTDESTVMLILTGQEKYVKAGEVCYPDELTAPNPVLGTSHSTDELGYGTSTPEEIFLGGDPTSWFSSLVWSDWGDAQATAEGTGYYVPPDGITADALPTPAVVVAFDLGQCNGQASYNAVSWYFPGEGESFNPAVYYDTCAGEFHY